MFMFLHVLMLALGFGGGFFGSPAYGGDFTTIHLAQPAEGGIMPADGGGPQDGGGSMPGTSGGTGGSGGGGGSGSGG